MERVYFYNSEPARGTTAVVKWKTHPVNNADGQKLGHAVSSHVFKHTVRRHQSSASFPRISTRQYSSNISPSISTNYTQITTTYDYSSNGILVQEIILVFVSVQFLGNHFTFYLGQFFKHFYFSFYTVQMQSFLFYKFTKHFSFSSTSNSCLSPYQFCSARLFLHKSVTLAAPSL